MKVIKTTVPCPSCQEPVCNLCAFNGMCQHCMAELPRATVAAAAREIEAEQQRLKDVIS